MNGSAGWYPCRTDGLGVSAVPRLVLPLMAFGQLVTRSLNDPGAVRKLAVYAPRTPVLPAASAYFLHRLLHTIAAAEDDGNEREGQGE
ncbi:hypothetical protein OG601_17975 [Streptomyces sp. NBC_01239]|uniref:hypothetical protein n=1 Tax=Streptomyces sp. NBC_01239 TaxID=2903792 RepID=UPI0022545DD9|nr:hypothetical protein [Streptomyces sp. NBC_01239]MCX4812495.1 hypothetical protein [Streptomyces sp. NBC_01239]